MADASHSRHDCRAARTERETSEDLLNELLGLQQSGQKVVLPSIQSAAAPFVAADCGGHGDKLAATRSPFACDELDLDLLEELLQLAQSGAAVCWPAGWDELRAKRALSSGPTVW